MVPEKKIFLVVLSLVAGICLSFLWVSANLPTVARAEEYDAYTTYYVALDGICGGKVPCYTTIQAAVDAVDSSSDLVKVAAGAYTTINTKGGKSQIVYINKTLTLRGGYTTSNWNTANPTANPTVLNAQGNGRGIYITGAINPTVYGFRITGGDATGLGGYDYYGIHDVGGGVYIVTATATLANNQIYTNIAQHGGGVFMIKSSGTLSNNTISENNVTSGGGGLGVYKGSPVINNNTIISNTSTNLGGGVYLFTTDATLTKNKISGNTASTLGGGIDVASCNPTFSGNLITGNTAQKGGGLYLWYSRSVFTNNVIADNKSTNLGSGLFIGGSQPRLLHTTIARNSGGDGSGVYVTSDGMTDYSTLAMTNTLMISHTVGVKVTTSNTLTINGVLWYSTPTTISQVSATVNVLNQYTGNPFFNTDGYHIKSNSAAINKGVPAWVYTDIDGQPRASAASDLGADEYWPAGTPKVVYLPIIIR